MGTPHLILFINQIFKGHSSEDREKTGLTIRKRIIIPEKNFQQWVRLTQGQ